MKKKKGIMKLAFMLVASGGLLIFTSSAQATDTGQQTDIHSLLRECCNAKCNENDLERLKGALDAFQRSGNGQDASKSGSGE